MSAKSANDGLPNLAKLRELRGVTREELGEAMNVTGRSVRRWENGESDPVLADLKKIAGYFGVTVAYLIGEVNEFAVPQKQRRSRPPQT